MVSSVTWTAEEIEEARVGDFPKRDYYNAKLVTKGEGGAVHSEYLLVKSSDIWGDTAIETKESKLERMAAQRAELARLKKIEDDAQLARVKAETEALEKANAEKEAAAKAQAAIDKAAADKIA